MSTTPVIKPEVPTCLADFDNSTLIEHPCVIPANRLFLVNDPKYGRGVWSATNNTPAIPINHNNLGFCFVPISPPKSNSRIFWGVKRNDENLISKLYMAESYTDCATEVEIPKRHRFMGMLSGKILLLEHDDHTDPHPQKLYSLETKGLNSLEDVKSGARLETIYVTKNKSQIMLIFPPNNSSKKVSDGGIFIIDEEKFTVERVK